MKLNKGIRRRTVVYFSITTLLLIFTTISMTVNLPQGLNHRHWRNGPGNVALGDMTTYWEGASITPEAERHAFTIARDENGEPTVKGMPLNLFVYGVGEDFQFPEHQGFKISNAMRITSYCLSILLILCFLGILASIIRGFRNGLYFSRMQVSLLRWSALFCFLLAIANELCIKFNMYAIGSLYGKGSDIKLATSFQMEIQAVLIPLLLLIFAEIINIALRLNKEEAMTI